MKNPRKKGIATEVSCIHGSTSGFFPRNMPPSAIAQQMRERCAQARRLPAMTGPVSQRLFGESSVSRIIFLRRLPNSDGGVCSIHPYRVPYFDNQTRHSPKCSTQASGRPTPEFTRAAGAEQWRAGCCPNPNTKHVS